MLTSARIKSYGMPPGWEPAGKTKLKKIIRWRKLLPDSFQTPTAAAVAAQLHEGV